MANGRQPAGKSEVKRGWGFRGEARETEVKRQKELAEQRNKQRGLRRFFLGYGEEAEIIILDNSFEDMFGIYEYEIWLDGEKFPSYETSPKSDGQEDPLDGVLMQRGKAVSPYFVTYATILDLTPTTFESKDGKTVTRPYTRKLLPIKTSSMSGFAKLSDSLVEEFGTLRGAHFKLCRGEEEKSAKIGQPFPIGVQYKHLSDDKLVAKYGHEAIKNKDGKVIIPANGLLEPYDYEDILMFSNPDELKRRYLSGFSASGRDDKDAWKRAVREDVEEETEEAPVKTTVQETLGSSARKASSTTTRRTKRVEEAEAEAETSENISRFSSEDLLTDDDVPF